MLHPSCGHAAQRPFTVRYTNNTNGDILLIGNTAMSCDPAAANCTNARNGTAANLNNNDYVMYYIDQSGARAAASSTSAVLGMPAGSTVLWAGLYWGGESSAAARSSVTLQTPSSSVTVNASQIDSVANVGCSNGCDRYSAFADVTNLVQVAGNGTYTVNGVTSFITNTAVSTYAGWSLVVVLQNASRPLRNLTVFDGLVEIGCSSPNTTTFPVSGFLTPYSGSVNTVMGVVAGEGDLGSYGDYLQLNNTKVGDTLRRVAGPNGDNFFMSANTNLGAYVANGGPGFRNLLGWDIGRVQANNILPNGSNSATISLGTAAECYYPNVTSFMTDLYVPIVAPNISKTAAKVGSGSLIPGDTLRFTVNIGNTGIDAATNVLLTDLIPTWTTYKPGTLQVLSGPNVGTKTDTAGNDQAEFCNSTTTPSCAQPTVRFRLGAGATGAVGGTLAQNAFTSISFDVTVNLNIPSGTMITNSASVSYNGQTIATTTFSDTTNEVQAVVLTPPTVTKSFSPAVVNIGGTSAMTITLTNPAGNAGTVSGISFTDTYPAGLINDTANPNPTVTCSAGSTPGSLVGGGAGGTSIGMTGASILQNGFCTVTVNVKSNINQNGNYLNATGTVTTSNAGTTSGASAYLSVGLPTIAKAFSTSPVTSPPAITTGGTATATFTLTSQAAASLTGVGFTDVLPVGLSVVTGSLNAAQCGGAVSYNSGNNTITLSGGTLSPPLNTCTVTVPVTSSTTGYYSNTANGVTSAQTAVAGPPSNTAFLTVNAPPNITKSFYPPSIIRGQDVSQLTITVTNPNSVNAAGTSTISGVAFTDTYPGTAPNNLVNTNNPLPTITCTAGSSAALTGGAPNGGTTGINGGTLAPGGSCTVTVYITAPATATPGNYVNSTGPVTTTNAGAGTAASGTVNVSNLSPPTTVKSFSPASVPKGQPSTLTIRITNANASYAITGVAFSDTYPAGLTNSGTPGAGASPAGCLGALTAASNGSSFALSGGTVPAATTCTYTVQVQGNAAGALFNAVPIVITGNAGTGAQASATLTVVDPPVITKSFSPNAIRTGSDTSSRFSTLTITVTNPATNNAALTTLTGVAFTDTYPANVVNNTDVGGFPAISCTSGSSATLNSTSGSVRISNGILAPGGVCTITAHVSSGTAGTYTNSTGPVTSTNGGTGNTAADILAVGHISITKSFAASPIPYGGTTTMTIVLTNARSSDINDAAFTDTYPAGMTNSATPAATMTCTSGTVRGTLTAPPNGDFISLSNGGTIARNGGTCTITVNVSAATSSADNIIPGLPSPGFTGGGDSNSDQAEAILTTYQPPGVVESFAPSSIGVNTPSVMTITISNPNSIAASGTSFTDSYTGGLVNTASPSATQTCSNGTTTGTVTAAANGTSLSLAGATIPANGSCTITVNVTSPSPGTITNQTGPVTSTAIGVNSSGASANLAVLALPTMTKSFSPKQINVNGTSSLTVTLTNPNSTPITGAAFTDTYPVSPIGLVNAAIPGATTSCLGGSITAAPGGTSFALDGATIPASGSCTVTVNVTSATANNYINSISQLVTDNAGTINFISKPQDTLRVVSLPAPTVAKSFLPAQIIVNGSPNTSTMTVTLTNNSATDAVTGLAFTDNLPPGLTISGTPATPQCGGAVSKPTSGTLQLTGGTILAGGNCTIVATVTSAVAGGYTNTITTVTSTNAGTGGPASASLSAVYNKPSATKSFNPTTIGTNGTSLLTITLTNPNPAAVTGVSTTDNYPLGLVNTGTPAASTTCGGSPVITAPANGNYITLSGATIPANNSCTVAVNVTSATAGTYANSTGPISSANAVTGDAFGPVNLTVVGTTVAKSFTPASVAAGQPSTMKFIITNNNTTTDITGVAFNDTFPAAPGQMVVAATPNLTNTCGGAVYRGGTTTPIAAGDTSLSFSGGAVLRNSSCTITLDIIVPVGGSYTNTTSQVTTANAGTGTAGTANLVANILPAPTTAKSFLPTAIGIGMPSTLTVTLTNNSSSAAVNGVTFTDSFPGSPGQMVVASSPNLNNGCGGTVTIAGDGKSFTLSGGTIPISGNCTIKLDVTATVAGSYTNSTGAVTSSNATAGSAATASLAVSGTTLDKKFNNVYATTIVATTTATLRFIITNGTNNPAQAGIGFTDTLETNLVVAGPPGANTCGASIYKGGTTTPISAGDTAITISGGALGAGVTSCSIDIPVTSSVRGTYQNDSTNISNPTINVDTTTVNAGLVTVLASPTLSKAFNPTLTSLPGNSTITFVITNNETGNPSISGLGFTDLLPNNLNVSGTLTSPQCNGTLSYTTNVPTNSSSITFANGTLNGPSCSISVPVTSANVASIFTNSYPANIGGLAGGLNASGASATLTVTSAAASLVKTFTPATIGIGGSSTLTLTINNANLNPAQSGLNFIDNLPSGLTIVGTPTSTCGGTLTSTGTRITLANGILAQYAASCAIIATVTSSAPGAYTNSTLNGNITNTGNKPDISGTGATLNVVNTTLGKAFLPNAIGVSQTTTLRFTINNGINNPSQTNLGFIDTLPANLTVAGTPASPQCGGSVAYDAGTNAITFAGGFLTSGTPGCTINVTVTGSSAATYTNSSANGNFSGATGGLNSSGAAAVLYVLRPDITKSFGTNPVLVNTPSTMTITLSNSNLTQDITGVSFTDTFPNLPGQMVVAPIPNLSNGCGGTSSASGTFVQLNGGVIPHNGSCTVAVDVIAPSAGSYVNNISTITTTNAGSVGPVTAPLTVLAMPAITVNKALGAGRASASDQFTVQIKDNANAVIGSTGNSTTSGSGAIITGGTGVSSYNASSLGGSYMLNEVMAGGSGSVLSQYTSALSCTNNGIAVPGLTAGQSFTPVAGDNYVCTITNTPKQATVTLIKNLAPVSDSGTFNLLVNGAPVITNVGNNGTGSTSLSGGAAVIVSETAYGSTNLANYDTRYACSGGITGTGTSVSITPAAGLTTTCTFTNTRKATVTVSKILLPSGDTGRFDLLAGATTVATNVGDTGNGSALVPANIAVSVSETAHTGTNLADYTTTYSCTGGITGAGTSVNITPSAGQAITCTFTNIRNGVNVTGTVYSDANHDAILNGGESGTGQSLFLKLMTRSGASCASPASVSAAADPATGTYTLPFVTPGDYCLIFDNSSTLSDTTPTYPNGWIGVEIPNGIRFITVGTSPLTSQNFGLYNGGRLSGRVFNDTGAGGGIPNNGIQEVAEAGLASLAVKVTDSGGGTVYDSAVTNGSGDYTLWIPVTAGNNSIKITETNPVGYVSTNGSGGTTGGSYNRAADTMTFTNTVGTIYSGVNFADVPGNAFVSNNSRSVVQGGVIFYPHTFTAGTGGQVIFTTSAIASPVIAGWSEVLYLDSNCNGGLDGGELQITGPITATAGQQVCILVKELAPISAPFYATNNVTVTASFAYSYSNPQLPLATLTVMDLATVMQASLTLSKFVDKASALPGDTLIYTITYTNTGSVPLTNIVINDSAPSYTSLILPYSSTICCVGPSGCLGSPASSYPASINGCTMAVSSPAIGWTLSGNLNPGASGQVKFSVKIDN